MEATEPTVKRIGSRDRKWTEAFVSMRSRKFISFENIASININF